ncbi:MAG: hypothetical protein US69_C0001G0042 [candidate division TM6 bacterium GW2011_GWF2_38_10]|nr:MAG: hypothetical protein US69_C0001G0042 [candidate division TM6 bacterium GW2011_GWF2_38_10]
MALIVEIKVVPNAKKQAISLEQHGLIKCHLKSQPEKGKANEELISFLSKQLGLAKQQVQIMAGHTSKKKFIKILDNSMTMQLFYDRCNLCEQKTLL